MKRYNFVAYLLLSLLSGCSLLPATVSNAEERAMNAVVQSAERAICRDIPIGTWARHYGSNRDRMGAWIVLCTQPTTNPPVTSLEQK